MDEYEDDMEQGAEKVPCTHIYEMPDGSFKVNKTEGPAPADAQEAGSLDEAMDLARQMASGGPEDMDSDDMAAAQAGYDKKAQPQMSAPNPGGVFGEG